MRKNTTVFLQVYKAIETLRRYELKGASALGSGALTRNSSGKASTLAGRFPRERVERFGCWYSPGRRKPKLWALLTCPQHVGRKHFVSSLSERHGSSNGHGTAPGNKTPEWRRCFRAFSYPLRRSPSSGHAASTQNTDYVREAEEAALL